MNKFKHFWSNLRLIFCFMLLLILVVSITSAVVLIEEVEKYNNDELKKQRVFAFVFYNKIISQ